MTAYPFMRMSREEFQAIKSKIKRRKEKRNERMADNLALMGSKTPQDVQGDVFVTTSIRTLKRRKRTVPARRRALNRLKEICKMFVLMRNAKTRNGMCEIAMACQGENVANTWYHGWPQKGGNGLKYDSRSHFASCGPCNMGEYGARMAGSPLYINRHKELLGSQWDVLNVLHGRRQISTKEALEMAREYENRIAKGKWSDE